jgi:predicted PP-loop superfamily ATPase
MIKRKKKGHADEVVDTSEDIEIESLENYKDFVKENVYLIQEELLKIRKNHPEMTS